VLAEITQIVEWRPRAGRTPGYDALRARDPGIAAEVLEDRASYLFWKCVQAGRSASLTPLRKCAAPLLLLQGERGVLDWMRGASDIAVGGVDVLECQANGAGANGSDRSGLDRIAVVVAWSARFGGAAAHTPVKTVLRMARKSGVRAPPSMTALVCQACGAPLVDAASSDSSKCEYCGAELAGGDQTWVLEALQ
jgi:ribosomal protein L37AE/L43A